jgi:hypothetical protein
MSSFKKNLPVKGLCGELNQREGERATFYKVGLKIP